MGNADLRTLAALSEVSFDEVAGSVVAVDAHNWLYRYLTTTVKWTSSEKYTTSEGEEVANLVGIVQGLPKFFEHDLTPVFVFDGGVTEMKDDEVAKRRKQREKAEERLEEAREAGDAVEAARMEARTQRLTETIQDTSRELLRLLDVPVVEAPAEGEAQASYMARKGDADYVGSEDYDTLLFGAPYTLRQLTSKGNPELMDLDATLEKHDISWEQLVDIAMLCGTDFNEGITGVGPKTAVKEVKKHGDLWSVLEARGDSIPNADRVREFFLDPPVTDDYDYNTGIDPDVDAAREFVTETWEVDPDEVRRGFERIEKSVTQTGLDRWT
ncbi:flap endonuclease-1 [Haloferax mediterranei ATCC 33500]|uniref:Flap endonuclease 1 n=1 Tax=Haloferax mediterranei (strain ATCC 33500 / DSM 1411 / JCM 8866 / NBRC 14739 / NCIMB 2177 / R-4) TaxID=523841 RepID=I3R8H7_HALMT|nr:flap endonuclease-1 [Haloferax mediterranei]AFK20537.1 flap endonuclease-1 [Haloferax mediterranei ATCC 33500]AHZ23894.1 endonuclease [Haloferax mediterranei ATCC 33500]ELZ98319.1 flap endonuclease-1 [Haloferax mediterranei ATCC 33500]MDX5986708.1 flap endonuclease-1 [Haloferax mediterranei ATCC 33500]QCQ76034.1 flap endonuclease-1 [Haloferax mediterranei ATCC 33500]